MVDEENTAKFHPRGKKHISESHRLDWQAICGMKIDVPLFYCQDGFSLSIYLHQLNQFRPVNRSGSA
jgi:hypothetical protein